MKASELLRLVGKPVAYYPKLAKPLGNANASIFFSHLFYWHDKTEHPLGIYRTAEEIENETGLTRDEQRTARKKLIACGVLIETHKRLEHRIYFKLDLAAFDCLLENYAMGSGKDIAEILAQSGSAKAEAPKDGNPRPEIGFSQSGKMEIPMDEIGFSQSYIGTEDLQKTYTEDLAEDSDTREASPVSTPPAKSKRKPKSDEEPLAMLLAAGVSEQVAKDHLFIRKQKGHPLTQTGLNRMQAVAVQFGMTLEQVLEFAIDRGWASVTAQYLHNALHGNVGGKAGGNRKPSVKEIPKHTVGGAFLAKDLF